MKSLDKSLRHAALVTAVAMALLPAAVPAQEGTAPTPDDEVDTRLAAATPVASNPVRLDAVIVTAQKRNEDVRDVPASVSVISDVQLEDFHATQLTDYAAYIPGFQATGLGGPGLTALSLRGIAPVSPGASVGTYIGDTPVGSSSFFAGATTFALDLLPYDIERIEVLRGPQGTLYGANTTGGLLKYVPRAPDLENFELRAGADTFGIASSDDFGWGSRVGINVPLVEGKLALRASYAEQDTPGFIDNTVTGENDQNAFKQQGGRVALLWQASEDVSLELSGMWQAVDADDLTIVKFLPSGSPVGDGRSNVNRIPESFEKELAYYAATLNWALGWADFVSATSYSDTTTHLLQDDSDTIGVAFSELTEGLVPDGLSRATADFELEKWTQEFRLSSATGGRVEWLVGTFFTHEDSEQLLGNSAQSLDGTPIPGLDPLAVADLPSTYKEYAVFGNLTYKFSERFDLGLGARWARNEQEFTQITSGGFVENGVFPGTSSENVWTYSLAPRFHLSEDAMLYARIASGYRSGGPNVVVIGFVPPPVESETLVSYEFGLKAEFLDQRALVDVALFYIDWDDIQLSTTLNNNTFVGNAGKAKSQGIELSTVLRPVTGLQLGFNAAYIDASLVEDAPGIGGVAGDRLPTIPEYSGALTADYSFPLRGDWTGHVGAGYRYVGERFSTVESSPDRVEARAYSSLDLNADLSNDRWTLRLFVKNATDKRADLRNNLVTDLLGQRIFINSVPLQPRTVGLALDLKY